MTPLRELYDLYYYPNPAKEERRRQLLAEISTDARDEDNYGLPSPLHAEHGARRAPSDASFALNSSGRKTHGKIRVSSPRDVIRQAGSRYAFFKGFKKVRLSA